MTRKAYFCKGCCRLCLELALSRLNTGELDRLHDLKGRIEESLPRLSLNREMARREFLIAPVLMDVLHDTTAALEVEYPVTVNHQKNLTALIRHPS